MPVTVRIPTYLAAFAEGRNSLALDSAPSTVRDVLSALWRLHPALQDRIVDEQGEIRPHINIFVDGEAIRHLDGLATPVRTDSEVLVVPAVSGGACDLQVNQFAKISNT
ncbi:MAG TPA: ubiquitin-like small modifier protein 1 [Terriglobales bacterium]|jgi:sulfur-carrier protein|nr:ubiquitin-like small modifier protein 1 [Terriglobales bacterium]